MFKTFAVVEPEFGKNKAYLPGKDGECFVENKCTFSEILRLLCTSKTNKKDVTVAKQMRITKMMEKGISVPRDCTTLNAAVSLVHDSYENSENYIDAKGNTRYFDTIVLERGEHQIKGEYLRITHAMNIMGDTGETKGEGETKEEGVPKEEGETKEVTKEEIVVVGGIQFEHGIQGNCHLQHLTLRGAMGNGVAGLSSFTMEDVLVHHCVNNGVVAIGAGVVGRCTNVEVRQCGGSGVVAEYGGSITLINRKTTVNGKVIEHNTKVHHNCTNRGLYDYGLKVYDSTSSTSSTIKLVSPLTKEGVSLANDGGGNWGADGGADLVRGFEDESDQYIMTI